MNPSVFSLHVALVWTPRQGRGSLWSSSPAADAPLGAIPTAALALHRLNGRSFQQGQFSGFLLFAIIFLLKKKIKKIVSLNIPEKVSQANQWFLFKLLPRGC